MSSKRTFIQHWPVLLLGLVVLAIFGTTLVVFTVEETECAMLLRQGKPIAGLDGKPRIYEAGLHFKMPVIDEVWRHDARLHHFQPNKPLIAQLQTGDGSQLLITNYACWRVDKTKADKFMVTTRTTEKAEETLSSIISSVRNTVIPKYNINQFINTDISKLKLQEIENELLKQVQQKSAEAGIQVERIGFRYIGFPEVVTNTVIQRMEADRKRLAMDYISEGEAAVRKISFDASREYDLIKTEAEIKATEIRQKVEATTYTTYQEFQKNPELAEFLSKIETLKKMGGPGTTVFIDTSMPPWDLLKADAIQFKSVPAAPVITPVKP
jgi:membrane protease subunit HflC